MDIGTLLEVKPRKDIPKLRPGDNISVKVKVVEGEKERLQVFKGVVISVNEGGIDSNFTVRRVAYGVGVERKFFVYSPRLEAVEVVKRSKVRRAKLYYLRNLSGKASKLKEVSRYKELAFREEGEQAELAMPSESESQVMEPPVASVAESDGVSGDAAAG